MRQTLKAKCVKTCDSLGFVVDIETNRATKMLLEVSVQKILHRDASLGCETIISDSEKVELINVTTVSLYPIKFNNVNERIFTVLY